MNAALRIRKSLATDGTAGRFTAQQLRCDIGLHQMDLTGGKGCPVQAAATLQKNAVDSSLAQFFHQSRKGKMSVFSDWDENDLTAC